MKHLKTLAVTGALAFAAVSSQASLQLNYSSIPNANMEFTGGGLFDFNNNVGGNDFTITGGGADSTGFMGRINGQFQMASGAGTSTTISTVSGGTLSITDGLGNVLSGTVAWVDLVQSGAGNTLNDSAAINLTGITYTGTSADLLALKTALTDSAVLTFSFNPPETLAQMYAGSVNTSFSGSIATAVPEPTSVLAGVLLLLPLGVSAIRIMRKNKVSASVP